MTTTDAAKLREAAQRLFSADSDYWFAIDQYYATLLAVNIIRRFNRNYNLSEQKYGRLRKRLVKYFMWQPTKTDSSKL